MEHEILSKWLATFGGVCLLGYFLLGLWQKPHDESVRFVLAWLFIVVSGFGVLFIVDLFK